MVYPVAQIKRGQTFMLFGYVNGIQGDVTTDWTDRNIIPSYKGTWGNIRKAGTVEELKRTVSFKDRRFARSAEHTSVLKSLMRNSYAVLCLKKNKKKNTHQ